MLDGITPPAGFLCAARRSERVVQLPFIHAKAVVIAMMTYFSVFHDHFLKITLGFVFNISPRVVYAR
jgi:hypothetical protein